MSLLANASTTITSNPLAIWKPALMLKRQNRIEVDNVAIMARSAIEAVFLTAPLSLMSTLIAFPIVLLSCALIEKWRATKALNEIAFSYFHNDSLPNAVEYLATEPEQILRLSHEPEAGRLYDAVIDKMKTAPSLILFASFKVLVDQGVFKPHHFMDLIRYHTFFKRSELIHYALESGKIKGPHFTEAEQHLIWIRAVSGLTDSLKLLVDNGFNIKARNAQGQTPLEAAMERGNRAEIALLKKLGASAEPMEENAFFLEEGKTPLFSFKPAILINRQLKLFEPDRECLENRFTIVTVAVGLLFLITFKPIVLIVPFLFQWIDRFRANNALQKLAHREFSLKTPFSGVTNYLVQNETPLLNDPAIDFDKEDDQGNTLWSKINEARQFKDKSDLATDFALFKTLADRKLTNENKQQCLIEAIKSNRPHFVSYILEKAAFDPEQQFVCWISLFVGSDHSFAENLVHLKTAGFDINIKHQDFTPLYYCLNGFAPKYHHVNALLKNGATYNPNDTVGGTSVRELVERADAKVRSLFP